MIHTNTLLRHIISHCSSPYPPSPPLIPPFPFHPYHSTPPSSRHNLQPQRANPLIKPHHIPLRRSPRPRIICHHDLRRRMIIPPEIRKDITHLGPRAFLLVPARQIQGARNGPPGQAEIQIIPASVGGSDGEVEDGGEVAEYLLKHINIRAYNLPCNAICRFPFSGSRT